MCVSLSRKNGSQREEGGWSGGVEKLKKMEEEKGKYESNNVNYFLKG